MQQTHILLIESDPTNLLSLQNILEPLGEKLVHASTKQELLHQFGRRDFAVVILSADSGDPIETAALIRQQDRLRTTPILFISSGEVDIPRLFSGHPVGSVDCLIKPIVAESLRARVITCLELYRKNQLLQQQIEEIARLNIYLKTQRMGQGTPTGEGDWFRTTLHSIGDAVLAIDTDSRVSFLNPVAEKLTGWSHDEAVGQDVHVIFNIINERSRKPAVNPIKQVLAEGIVVGLANHTLLISRDGREIPIDDSAAPIQDSSGNITGAILVFRDVTDQKRAYNLQAQLAAIIKGSDDAIISKDLQGIVTSWNAGAERMYGYTAEEIVGKPITVLIPPDWPNDVPQILERIKRGEGVVHYETRRMAKDGTVLDVSLTISPIYDDEQNVIGASKIARDITQQKRFRAIQTQLAAIVESSDDAIISKDLQGTITSWNKAAERMYGYTAEDIIGKPITVLIPSDWPNDVPQILERIKRGERVIHYETRRMAKDGRVLDVSLTVSPIHDDKGNIIGASKIAREITEQKRFQELQAQLAAIVESSDDAIIGKDLHGYVTSWNAGAEHMYGYTAEEIVGKSITILIPPTLHNDVPDILNRIRQGERVIHYETKRMAKDGRVLDVSLTVSPIHDHKGNIIGASKIARDITERKQREARLTQLLESEQQARTEAEQALHIRDEFLSVAAHELRTPITSLRGFTDSFLRQINRHGTVAPENLKRGLTRIDEQSRKLTSLINQLLDISRLEAGKLNLEPAPTDVTNLAQAMVEQAQLNTDRHTIVLHSPPSVEATLDRLRIEQVLTNLLDNAIKYSERGTIAVNVSMPTTQIVRIAVSDEGEGIAPEHQDRLFERFYQGGTMPGGMGLGLYISRQIVEMHGGTLNAEFPPEGGTCFVIELPIDAAM